MSRNTHVLGLLINAVLTLPLYDEPQKHRERKGDEEMRAYYWKVFRHLLSTTVLTGFSAFN